ncbi:hypothetical protein [Ktedonospora formicarum]|uniref:HAMP domain-containing protein n=1 Tax=Ktedonospora formicarum TaxID=2778364 RepID=A0A8J3MQ23_9CHLR|nr:hypothetical protein [Ktedonospora formicarum]GHO42178.1 hypothetical protein KSX_03410 [Ktedonospora formicarum]
MSYERKHAPASLSSPLSQSNGSVATFTAPEMTPRPDSHAHQVFPQRYIAYYTRGMGLFFVIHLAYLLFLQTRSDVLENAVLRDITDILVLIGAIGCTGVCGIALWKLRSISLSDVDILAKRAWIAIFCLGASSATYAIGQVIWTWYEATTPLSAFPFPAAYDPFYLAVYPFSWIGVALLLPRGGTGVGRLRLVLDATTAVVSVLAISWYFLLGPTIANLTGEPLAKIVALAYPLGDLSLCIAAAILLFGTSGSTSFNSTLAILSAGVSLLAVTDSFYAYFLLQGTYHTGFLQDVGWPLSWLLIGWAVLTYLNNLARGANSSQLMNEEPSSTRLSRTGAVLRAVAPTILALLTCALLVLEVELRQSAPLFQVVLVCAGLFLLPIIRQGLTLVDNMLLNERLRVALNQSQQAFRDSQKELLSTTSRATQYEELRTSIENLRTVHAALARGDLSIRAQTQGPLAPVAQSLNLLIERMHRWEQMSQQNRILQNEARFLAGDIEMLSQGRLPQKREHIPSTLPTGAAVISLLHLSKRLHIQFRRLSEALEQLYTRNRSLRESVTQTRNTLQDQSSSQQLDALLVQLEKGLTSYENMLLEAHKLVDIFSEQNDQKATPNER